MSPTQGQATVGKSPRVRIAAQRLTSALLGTRASGSDGQRPEAVQALKLRETFSAYTQVAMGEGSRRAEGSGWWTAPSVLPRFGVCSLGPELASDCSGCGGLSGFQAALCRKHCGLFRVWTHLTHSTFAFVCFLCKVLQEVL